MSFVRSFQDFLSKKYYNFDKPDITLLNFHPQLYMILASQGVFFGKKDSYLRFIIPIFCIGVNIIAAGLEICNISLGVLNSDYNMACESLCYIIILGSCLTVYIGSLSNQQQIYGQIQDMEKDFKQICSFGPRHREPFLAGQLIVWKLCIIWTVWLMICGGMYLMYPTLILLYQSLIATQDENIKRPLVFPMWFPHDDPYRTPNYEALFALESLYTVVYVTSFGGYVYALFHFLLHYYIMMDMIILDFQAMFDGLDESVAELPKTDPRRIAVQRTLNQRLGRIVNWHVSVYRAIKRASIIFRPTMIYIVRLTSAVICLVVYQIVEKFEHGVFEILFTFLGASATLQLWIPCYLGTILRNKGFAVGEACWRSGWHETRLGRMIATEIVLIIYQAQVPIIIKYTGQPGFQLETFSAMMSAAYSYFNMLRQAAISMKE